MHRAVAMPVPDGTGAAEIMFSVAVLEIPAPAPIALAALTFIVVAIPIAFWIFVLCRPFGLPLPGVNGLGEAESEECPVNILPAERVCHGWQTPVLQAKLGLRSVASRLRAYMGERKPKVQWTFAVS